MSSPYLEGLELKEATPSIAPSIYESFQYTKKWRIGLALGIGICLIGVCSLIFYLSTESRKMTVDDLPDVDAPFHLANGDDLKRWRSQPRGKCVADLHNQCPSEYGDKSVIVLAFGGLTGSQIDSIPALKELIRCGVTTEGLTPSYPSYSIPNFYSIATGLYPESHGIIGSQMFDSAIGSNFSLESPSYDVPQWWGGEPLWNIASKQKKRSAAYLWPGSKVVIKGLTPTLLENEKLVFGRRIRQLISWLQLPPNERPHLLMMYYEEPLTTAHKFGPDSKKIQSELRKINFGVDDLVAFLERTETINCVDIVIVSDQGVAPSACDSAIYVDDLINEAIKGKIVTGPVGRILFQENIDPKIKNEVQRKLQCKNPNLRVLTKHEVPKRYHYANNDRIGDLVLDTKLGSRIATAEESECPKGSNGYDILEKQMQGIFVGHGPSFKTNIKTKAFRNVEIYNLICSLLNINAAPNNGTTGSLNEILVDPRFKPMKIRFLKEKLLPRPNRPVGDEQESIEDCQCDGSHLRKTTTVATTLPPTTTTSLPSTTTESSSTSTVSSTTTIITSSTTSSTSQVPSSSSSSSPSNSELSTENIITIIPGSSSTTTAKIENNSESIESTTLASILTTLKDANILPTEDDVDEVVTVTPSSSAPLTNLTSLELSHAPPLVKATTSILNLEPAEDIVSFVRKRRNTGDHLTNLVRNDNNETLFELRNTHCPWGCPKYAAPEVASDVLNVLSHTNYLLAIPESLSLSVWLSYTFTKDKLDRLQTVKPTLPEGVVQKSESLMIQSPKGCWIADPRLSRSSSDQCSRSFQTKLYEAKNIFLRQLYPEELEFPSQLTQEGFLLSNLAPLHWSFIENGRRIMLNVIKKWTEANKMINVQFGPIFDYNLNGKKDDVSTIRNKIKPLIPSNFFFVLSVCGDSKASDSITKFSNCQYENFSIYSFVFPNSEKSDMCLMNDVEYLQHHMTSLKDVEDLTGLRFFRNIPAPDYARLKTVQVLQFPIQ